MRPHWLLAIVIVSCTFLFPWNWESIDESRHPASITSLGCTDTLDYIITQSRIDHTQGFFRKLFRRVPKDHHYKGYVLSKMRYQKMAEAGTLSKVNPDQLTDAEEWLGFIEVYTKQDLLDQRNLTKRWNKVENIFNKMKLEDHAAGRRGIFGLPIGIKVKGDGRYSVIDLRKKVIRLYRDVYKSPFRFRYLRPSQMDELIWRITSEDLMKKGLVDFLTEHKLVRTTGLRVKVQEAMDSRWGKNIMTLMFNFRYLTAPTSMSPQKYIFFVKNKELPLPDGILKKIALDGLQGNEELVRQHLTKGSTRLAYAYDLFTEKYPYAFMAILFGSQIILIEQTINGENNPFSEIAELSEEEQQLLQELNDQRSDFEKRLDDAGIPSECFGLFDCINSIYSAVGIMKESYVLQCQEISNADGECEVNPLESGFEW